MGVRSRARSAGGAAGSVPGVTAGLGRSSITSMAEVPAACQALADQVSTLDQQYSALVAQVSQEEGAQAWQDLARLGGLRQQLEAAQAALDGCVQANSAALTGIVNVIDATGAAAQGTQTVTLWDVSGASAVPAGQAPVTSGAFGLKGPVPAKPALTLQTTGAAGFSVTGYDFRSGPLPDPLPAPPMRCEMVICPQVVVPPAAVHAWASSFQAVHQQVSLPTLQGSVAVALSSVTVAFAAGTITATATGTINGSILGGTIPLNQIPFSADVPFSLAPSGSPQTGDVVDFAIVGPGPVIKILAGPMAVLNSFLSYLQPFIKDPLQNSLSPWVEQVMPKLIAAALALPQLPPSTTITLRSLKIDGSGITLQPVLGTIGTGLSTFKPVPLPAS